MSIIILLLLLYTERFRCLNCRIKETDSSSHIKCTRMYTEYIGNYLPIFVTDVTSHKYKML